MIDFLFLPVAESVCMVLTKHHKICSKDYGARRLMHKFLSRENGKKGR